jgi:pantoate--beta-alanine ligase
MRVLDRGDQLRKELDTARAGGATVGLVPTMGFLHEGHASLIRRSAAECDVTAVTVFVNPLQFGPTEDLASYPADLDHDVAVASDAGAQVLFAPPVDDMYPGGRPGVTVHVEGADTLEGASRPGHFDGVATVVAKLFNLAGPCRAYFGEKDWQQLEVVRRLAADLSFPVEVVACPTVREADGLACSSRNVRLSPAERAAATVLYRALTAAAGDPDPRRRMAEAVAGEPLATLDYAEVLPDRLLIAARIGGVRLIDNLEVPCAAA